MTFKIPEDDTILHPLGDQKRIIAVFYVKANERKDM